MIEEEIYKEFNNTDNKYKNKVRSRVANLRDKKNPALRENVLLGSISAEKLAKMSPEVCGTTVGGWCPECVSVAASLGIVPSGNGQQ